MIDWTFSNSTRVHSNSLKGCREYPINIKNVISNDVDRFQLNISKKLSAILFQHQPILSEKTEVKHFRIKIFLLKCTLLTSV